MPTSSPKNLKDPSVSYDPADLLPLRPLVFNILLSLAEGALHGHEIMKWTNHRMGSRAVLGPGTLYRTLKELKEEGFLQHEEIPETEGSDGRRQYYGLTPLGRGVVTAEARRLKSLLLLDRTKTLLSESGLGG